MHKKAKSKPSITAITMGGIIMAKIIPTTKPIIQKTAIFLYRALKHIIYPLQTDITIYMNKAEILLL